MRPSPSVKEIPYVTDTTLWFMRLKDWRHPVWLDSGRPLSQYGRYDILAAEPDCRLETWDTQTRIYQTDSRYHTSDENPFALIERHRPSPLAAIAELPFVSGAIGYFGYDLGRRTNPMTHNKPRDLQLPDMWLGFYAWALIQDHQRQRAFLVARPDYPLEQLGERLDLPTSKKNLKQFLKSSKKSFNISSFERDMKVDYYLSSLAQIQDYIHCGDCYQVNFAQRFSANCTGDPFTAYLKLRQILPSPFSGYIPLTQGTVMSFSPERFIQLQQGRAEAKPIKGTIARGETTQKDRQAALKLQASAKNRAENLMIVDLLRNDLSKNCHRIEVPQLCELQSFANVHHLVSTVTGQLNSGASDLDLLAGCFPGGSITGAPKIRAMEIIDELEPCRRSVYCGSLGYLSADGGMDTSIAIRTLACDRGHIHCWGGGGIVADSDPQEEYRESLAKVALLMNSLEENFGTNAL